MTLPQTPSRLLFTRLHAWFDHDFPSPLKAPASMNICSKPPRARPLSHVFIHSFIILERLCASGTSYNPALCSWRAPHWAYSLHRSSKQGMAWSDFVQKALKRSAWLFFWGVLDYAVRKEGLAFELWDVLTQLSFTTLVAFLIFRWSMSAQLVFSFGLLLLTEILYRYNNVPNFDQPFTTNTTSATMSPLVDEQNKRGGWVAINCLPTAAHNHLGCHSRQTPPLRQIRKTKVTVACYRRCVALVLGFAMDFTITPINQTHCHQLFRAGLGWLVSASNGRCSMWIDISHPRPARKSWWQCV